ncbi:heavy-metal-associated domain-containing protein [Methylomonas paludis]|uniref:Heavy-metal-associated domain-containing protein n=1 Tax=Methylomonas paludis TaxID=1173101 RepID=A0A975MPE7_9GAMM|nr:heavy-metal-associated domain-containing protein [Methylomonas paludis]QWF71603.1 heavy-metal-associated domain-containing protein [Methylomonas paludis]
MTTSITLSVTGMKCGGCETNVTSKLGELAGVIAVQASHQQNSVIVEYDPEKTDIDAIEDVITAAGYHVK